MAGMTRAFAAHGCRSVFEIGVGTGRAAAPLAAAGLEMTGLDISRKMLERARSKGLAQLVVGDGAAPPFRGGSFDAVLMVHAVHLFRDQVALMREVARISRVGAFVLLTRTERERGPGGRSRSGGARLGMRLRRRDMMVRFPPDEVAVVSDVIVDGSFRQKVKNGRGARWWRTYIRSVSDAFTELWRMAGLGPSGPTHEVSLLLFWRSERFSAPRAPA